MTAESVTAKKDDVDRENDCADANAEPAIEPDRFPNVVEQDQNKNQREIKKVTMNVLHDERERSLAPVCRSWFANGAARRIRPKRFVVRAAIVITRHPESARGPKN